MSNTYIYLEYPKCLYRGYDTCTVQSEEAEVEAKNDGWLTAGQFHGTEPMPGSAPPAPPDDPVVEPVSEPAPTDEPDKKSSKKGK
jgi:hypothetical protein